jgi:hypothetical protein
MPDGLRHRWAVSIRAVYTTGQVRGWKRMGREAADWRVRWLSLVISEFRGISSVSEWLRLSGGLSKLV